MEPIFLPQLARAPERTEVVAVNENLAELETLTPVQGELTLRHQGNYLQVEGSATAIVTLTCDRCLQQYNFRLETEATELIWLREEERSLADPDAGWLLSEGLDGDPSLLETLPPNGYFHPEDWIYQQLCLQLPQQQLCSQDCIALSVDPLPADAQPPVDPRWAALKNLI